MVRQAVDPALLYRPCDPAALGFRSTAELVESPGVICQERAVEAVEFAVGMSDDGYNVFVLGPEGTGKLTLIRQIFSRAAAANPVPPDACYVHNFGDPRRPRALLLPPGSGRRFRADMEQLVVELRGAIRAALDSEPFRAALEALESELRARRERAIDEFAAQAAAKGFAVIRSPLGVSITAVRDGRPLETGEFEKMSQADRDALEKASGELQQQLAVVVRQFPGWEREFRSRARDLGRETTRQAVDHLIEELQATYRDLPQALEHLANVRADVIENAQQLVEGAPGETPGATGGLALPPGSPPWARRYLVNLLVDHTDTPGAPVVIEDHPALNRLVGRVEHVSVLGALMTDFSLIWAGALHRANGGYLVLDVRKVLSQPLAWEGLKRALTSREVRPESLGEAMSLISTVTLEPMPIPLRVKVALIGDRELYYLLAALDPEFRDLFKVQADLDDDVPRSAANTANYARMVAGLVAKGGLAPLDAPAVARVIEEMARRAGAADRLSSDMRFLAGLLREAHQESMRRARGGAASIMRADVEAALAGQRRRAGRLQEEVLDAIRKGTLVVDTRGTAIGQVNALTVAELGETTAAWPTRVTARARPGEGEVVDIEREVKLGGPIHSKGVLILTGFLGERYARGFPLSLQGSLVFEQSYGSVEGDSASLAEACALLSAIGRLELRQGLAVTGSIDQHGDVQAVGAVNAKIEGFFDVCRGRGLTGQEGVIIPKANVRSLMLRADVVEAARVGTFSIHAVASLDQAMGLLTGMPAGRPRAPEGGFPRGSVNAAVHARLRAFAEEVANFGQGKAGGRSAARRSRAAEIN